VSDAGLLGGGSGMPRPGEVSLAHNGVLFLDEFPEFPRNVLEQLRQPMEEGSVTLARAQMTLHFPARFMLLAAMNPCPCGFYGDPTRECRCTGALIQRYMSKLSGPLLDRIDIHVEVPPVDVGTLLGRGDRTGTAALRDGVLAARERQAARNRADRGGAPGRVVPNAQLGPRGIDRFCRLAPSGDALLAAALERLGLSARGVHRVLKVARTVADLAGSEEIVDDHLAEAIQYRSLDREVK
jgi:magnesium chelatase family protein